MFEVVMYPRKNPICYLSKSGFRSQKASEQFLFKCVNRFKVNLFGYYRKDFTPFGVAEIREIKKGKTKIIRKILFTDKEDIIEKVAI